MAPRASSSKSNKRKAASSTSEDEDDHVDASSAAVTRSSQTQKSNKRQKSQKEAVVPPTGSSAVDSDPAASAALAPNGQPTNKGLPPHIAFPAKLPRTIRIATWNVCGLASSQKKGFKSYLEAEDPDIIVLTETKVNNPPVDPYLTTRYPHCYWSIAEKKGYSGTAILSKFKPISTTQILPDHPDPGSIKGRLVTLEYENFYLIGTYVTNAGQNLKTLSAKEEWNKHFTKYIRDLDAKKPVIWTGDLNVAPTEIDLSNAKTNWNKTAGYTESETKAYANILTPSDDSGSTAKFTDVWRKLHPDDRHYTFFGYRFNCRAKGIGWRLDMFVVSERLVDKVKLCEIRSEIYGASDHCPVVMEIEGIN